MPSALDYKNMESYNYVPNYVRFFNSKHVSNIPYKTNQEAPETRRTAEMQILCQPCF
jgi:hypothetical protein